MKTITSALALLLLCTTAPAQWQSYGPFGAKTRCHIEVGANDFAGTSAGLFRSTNGATTWAPFGTGLPNEIVESLFFDGTVMYAGIDQEGLYVSSDQGATWTAANNAAMGSPYFVFFIGAHNGSVIVATNTGRWTTTDQGASFTAMANTPDYSGPMLSTGTALITTDVFGFPGFVYRSTDNGASWTLSTTGMGADPRIIRLYTIGGAIYAVGYHMHRSTDDGMTWTTLTSAPSNYPPTYTCAEGNTIYVSTDGNVDVPVYKFTIDGSAWVSIVSGLPDTWTNVLFAIGSDVYIDKNGELFKSTDGGASWNNTGNTGMIGVETFGVHVEGSLVLAGAAEAIHRSTDNGTNWVRTATVPINTVRDFHRFGTKLFASTDGAGLFVSDDDGLTWPTQQLADYSIYSITSNTSDLFAGGSISNSPTVQRSTNGGTTWVDHSTGLPGDAVVLDLLELGGMLYAGIGASQGIDAGVYVSSSTSANWVQMVVGMANLAGTAFVHNTGNIYVGTEIGVYVSTNLAATWSPVGAALTGISVHDIVVDGNDVIAATEEGVYLLQSGSADWVAITDNLMEQNVAQLALNFDNDYLYAATHGRSVAQRLLSTVGVEEETLDAATGLSISPNPVDRLFTLTCSAPLLSSSLIALRDMTGRVVPVPIEKRASSAMIDAQGLSSGAYTITVTAAGNLFSTRIIKL